MRQGLEKDTYNTLLIEAVKKNSPISEILGLITRGADPNAIDENGDSILHLAIKNGHYELAAFLIEQENFVGLKGNFVSLNLNAVNKRGLSIASLILPKPNQVIEYEAPSFEASQNFQVLHLFSTEDSRLLGTDFSDASSPLIKILLRLLNKESFKEITELQLKAIVVLSTDFSFFKGNDEKVSLLIKRALIEEVLKRKGVKFVEKVIDYLSSQKQVELKSKRFESDTFSDMPSWNIKKESILKEIQDLLEHYSPKPAAPAPSKAAPAAQKPALAAELSTIDTFQPITELLKSEKGTEPRIRAILLLLYTLASSFAVGTTRKYFIDNEYQKSLNADPTKSKKDAILDSCIQLANQGGAFNKAEFAIIYKTLYGLVHGIHGHGGMLFFDREKLMDEITAENAAKLNAIYSRMEDQNASPKDMAAAEEALAKEELRQDGIDVDEAISQRPKKISLAEDIAEIFGNIKSKITALEVLILKTTDPKERVAVRKDLQRDMECFAKDAELFSASFNDDAAKTTELLRLAANPNCQRQDGATPFFIACAKGNDEVVISMLDCKTLEPNIAKIETGFTPLHIAAQECQIQVLEYLLNDRRVTVNSRTTVENGKRTALMTAFEGSATEDSKIAVLQTFDKYLSEQPDKKIIFQAMLDEIKIDLINLKEGRLIKKIQAMKDLLRTEERVDRAPSPISDAVAAMTLLRKEKEKIGAPQV